MAPLIPLVTFSVLSLCLAAQAQQLTIVTPPNSSVVQCANLTIEWSGGVSPFFLTMGTPDDAKVTDFEAVQSVDESPYIWDVDMPAGTEITLFVRDADGTTAETPILAVQNSTNSSCFDSGESAPPPTVPSHTRTNLEPTGSQTRTTTSASTTNSASTTGSSTPQSSSSTKNSQVAIIAGVVIGCLVILALIIILMTIQKRRSRRQHTSSKEAFVRTFGSARADLDGFTEDDTEAMTRPEPYVYGSVSHAPSTLAPIETADLSRSPSASRPSPAGPAATTSPSTPMTRKGERYLPNFAPSPQERSPSGVSSSRSGIQEEDIDRLAARMVAMMSAGRIPQQAWTPTSGVPGRHGGDIDDGEDGVQVPPPLYKDVARRSGARPGGGRF